MLYEVITLEASKLERKWWNEKESAMVKEMTDKGWCEFNEIADIKPFADKVKYLQDRNNFV